MRAMRRCWARRRTERGGHRAAGARTRRDQQARLPNYFLIVWDFVRHAPRERHPATARGSAASARSFVMRCISATFARSNTTCCSSGSSTKPQEAPDIDIDFCKDRRSEVIDYVKDKYGEANVAQIGTFGTLQARAAIKDVGRVLGMPIDRVEQNHQRWFPKTLAYRSTKRSKKPTSSSSLRTATRSARGARSGAPHRRAGRNIGTHAAAVVIADKPLTSTCRSQAVVRTTSSRNGRWATSKRPAC
jgi:DNA polymerase-3 subunit alpha